MVPKGHASVFDIIDPLIRSNSSSGIEAIEGCVYTAIKKTNPPLHAIWYRMVKAKEIPSTPSQDASSGKRKTRR